MTSYFFPGIQVFCLRCACGLLTTQGSGISRLTWDVSSFTQVLYAVFVLVIEILVTLNSLFYWLLENMLIAFYLDCPVSQCLLQSFFFFFFQPCNSTLSSNAPVSILISALIFVNTFSFSDPFSIHHPNMFSLTCGGPCTM